MEDDDMERLVDRAVSSYVALLDRDGSPVLAEAPLRAQLVHQARSVALHVGTAFGLLDEPSTTDNSERIGNQRARSAVHPAQSLRAGSLMFEALFPVLAQASEGDAIEVGVALEKEIQRRLAVGSIPYVDYLLTTFLSSQHEQRGRIARDLHDRIAHGMGAALQQLDLFDHYRTLDPARADAHFGAARDFVLSSVDNTRRLSADLWVRAPGESLRQSLESYLDSTAQDGTRTTVVVHGDEPPLGADVAEELYLLLREAVRNALTHAKPTAIEVRLISTVDLLSVQVVDDGCGFDVDEVTSIKTVGGLASIRERAELLGGRASITSEPGAGTIVEVHYPMPSSDGQSW